MFAYTQTTVAGLIKIIKSREHNTNVQIVPTTDDFNGSSVYGYAYLLVYIGIICETSFIYFVIACERVSVFNFTCLRHSSLCQLVTQ